MHITKRLRQIRNARHFRFALNLVFTAQWFRLGGRRCSLLNAALAVQTLQVSNELIFNKIIAYILFEIGMVNR